MSEKHPAKRPRKGQGGITASFTMGQGAVMTDVEDHVRYALSLSVAITNCKFSEFGKYFSALSSCLRALCQR